MLMTSDEMPATRNSDRKRVPGAGAGGPPRGRPVAAGMVHSHVVIASRGYACRSRGRPRRRSAAGGGRRPLTATDPRRLATGSVSPRWPCSRSIVSVRVGLVGRHVARFGHGRREALLRHVGVEEVLETPACRDLGVVDVDEQRPRDRVRAVLDRLRRRLDALARSRRSRSATSFSSPLFCLVVGVAEEADAVRRGSRPASRCCCRSGTCPSASSGSVTSASPSSLVPTLSAGIVPAVERARP